MSNSCNIKELKYKDIKPLREEFLKNNNGLCPICQNPITEGRACLDHSHQSGLVRDTLCSSCNQWEGAIRSKWVRYGLSDKCDIVTMLLNMADHLKPENEKPFMHPSEIQKKPKLMKSSYNQLVKEIKNANRYLKKPIKIPCYPKSKKLTKRLKELYEQFGVFPKFYSR